MAKPDVKKRAVGLRKEGYSYSLIKEKLDVPKSTISRWVQDVPYTPNEETKQRTNKAQLKAAEAKRRERKKSTQRAHKEARQEISDISERDLFMLGIGLYIGEGTKSHTTVRVVNANPEVICLAVAWFRQCLDVPMEHFSLAIHLYPDNNKERCLEFWSQKTGIPRAQFGKTQIDDRQKKSQRKKGKWRHGTAHLSVLARGDKQFGSFLSRKIDGYIEAVYRQSQNK